MSLSANDNVLPTTTERTGITAICFKYFMYTKSLFITEGDVVTNYFSKRSKKYGLLTFFNYAKESVLPQRTKKGF